MINPRLANSLKERKALKVISGLNNFDLEQVTAVCKAAEVGGATFVDIAADVNLIQTIRELISLPICVSAVKPEVFVEAVAAGAEAGKG